MAHRCEYTVLPDADVCRFLDEDPSEAEIDMCITRYKALCVEIARITAQVGLTALC